MRRYLDGVGLPAEPPLIAPARSPDGLRHLWGGHYQGWNNPTPHPEDNTADNSTVTAYKNQLPLLKKLLEDPVN